MMAWLARNLQLTSSCLLGHKLREFQFKLLTKYLVTNAFLYKIGVLPSSACSFCGKENESLEHTLISWNYAKEFWVEVIRGGCSLKVNINNLNNKEIMLGMPNSRKLRRRLICQSCITNCWTIFCILVVAEGRVTIATVQPLRNTLNFGFM